MQFCFRLITYYSSSADIKQEVWKDVHISLFFAELLKNKLHHKVGKQIIRDLLNSNQGIKYLEFKRLFKYSDEDMGLLQ